MPCDLCLNATKTESKCSTGLQSMALCLFRETLAGVFCYPCRSGTRRNTISTP